jgi:hypothetical protein
LPWDFAVEIGVLLAAGATTSALRWLVYNRYVEHARERTLPRDATRTFQRRGGVRFGKTTCFILTEAGTQFARAALATFRPRDDCHEFARIDVIEVEDGQAHGSLKPTWDWDRQELRLGNTVVKRFKVPAVNQQLVLSAFEEEGWPVRIDDPLPPPTRARSQAAPSRYDHLVEPQPEEPVDPISGGRLRTRNPLGAGTCFQQRAQQRQCRAVGPPHLARRRDRAAQLHLSSTRVPASRM